MRNLQSLRLLLADKDKEIERLKERLFLYESDNDTVIMTGEKWEEIKEENKRLKKELTEEKKAHIKMYNMYVEKENIIKELENELEKDFHTFMCNSREVGKTYKAGGNNYRNHILLRLKELKGINEPSFEEMVGFVENVYKDIKSQSTLQEELEKERKTIAKIVGDFKEVNK